MGKRFKVTEISPELKQFVAECDARRANLEITADELGVRCKLGPGWVRRFLRGEELNPTVESLRKLATALDLNFVLAVCPKKGSYDDQTTGVYTRRVLAQLVPAD